MTMWRSSEPAEEDVSGRPGIDPQSKRRRSRRRAWRDGLADQTVVQNLEHVRSYRAFERSLIGSVGSSVRDRARARLSAGKPLLAPSSCRCDRNGAV
jgi:hypothetical protein